MGFPPTDRFAPALGAAGAVALLLAAAAAGAPASPDRPPREEGTFRAPALVELHALDRTLKLDVRYATAANFVGRAVYGEARAFLQAPAARALVRAHRRLAEKGYGIVVFDGYRPWRVTKLFWDATPEEQKVFVADPAKGSKHNRGCAVDVSLFDRATGETLDMGSDYDEASPRSYVTWDDCPREARRRREALSEAMSREGFFVYAWEWWHFDYKDWRDYPILDVPFSRFPPLAAPAEAGRR